MTALDHPEEPAVPVPVDLPEQRQPLDVTTFTARTIEARPIVPVWLRNREEARALLGWLGKYGLHVGGYHLTHLPVYLARLAARSPWGLWKAGAAGAVWVLDRE